MPKAEFSLPFPPVILAVTTFLGSWKYLFLPQSNGSRSEFKLDKPKIVNEI